MPGYVGRGACSDGYCGCDRNCHRQLLAGSSQLGPTVERYTLLELLARMLTLGKGQRKEHD